MPTPPQYYTAAVLGLAAFSAFKSASADMVTLKKDALLDQAYIPGKCTPNFNDAGAVDFFRKYECTQSGAKVKETRYSDCQCATQTQVQEVDSGDTVATGVTIRCETSKTASGYVESASFSGTAGCNTPCNFHFRPYDVCMEGDIHDPANGAGKSYKYTKTGTTAFVLKVYDNSYCSLTESKSFNFADDQCSVTTGKICADKATAATPEVGEKWKSNQWNTYLCSLYTGTWDGTSCASTDYRNSNVCTACPSGHTCDGTAATPCATTKYVTSNVCTACPSGHTCDGAVATLTSTSAAASTRSTALAIWATVASLLIFFPL